MEFKLNIYDGKTVEKTYRSNDFVLTVGVAEDILKLIEVDKFAGNLDDTATLIEIIKIVKGAFNSFNPMMKGVFDGLTDDEFARADIIEIAVVVIDILKYTIVQLNSAAHASAGKN